MGKGRRPPPVIHGECLHQALVPRETLCAAGLPLLETQMKNKTGYRIEYGCRAENFVVYDIFDVQVRTVGYRQEDIERDGRDARPCYLWNSILPNFITSSKAGEKLVGRIEQLAIDCVGYELYQKRMQAAWHYCCQAAGIDVEILIEEHLAQLEEWH